MKEQPRCCFNLSLPMGTSAQGFETSSRFYMLATEAEQENTSDLECSATRILSVSAMVSAPCHPGNCLPPTIFNGLGESQISCK